MLRQNKYVPYNIIGFVGDATDSEIHKAMAARGFKPTDYHIGSVREMSNSEKLRDVTSTNQIAKTRFLNGAGKHISDKNWQLYTDDYHLAKRCQAAAWKERHDSIKTCAWSNFQNSKGSFSQTQSTEPEKLKRNLRRMGVNNDNMLIEIKPDGKSYVRVYGNESKKALQHVIRAGTPADIIQPFALKISLLCKRHSLFKRHSSKPMVAYTRRRHKRI